MPDGSETWQMLGSEVDFDWDNQPVPKVFAPGTFVRALRSGENETVCQRGRGCRPQGMVIANQGSDHLILWFASGESGPFNGV